jgi:histidinol-phosphatase
MHGRPGVFSPVPADCVASLRDVDYVSGMTTPSNSEAADRLQLALLIGREAGQFTLQYFQRDNFDVERKSDRSPVTVADRGAEQLLRDRILAAYPTDGIIGEEWGAVEGSSGYTWILDPIDGTKSFISGVPLYGTMIGIEHAGRSVAGYVYIPGLDEGVYAASGSGAWHFRGTDEPRQVFVSKKRSLAEALVVTSQVDTFAKRGAADVFAQLERSAYITRTWGDCYGYLLVATGRAEVMIDPMLNVWDAAAVQPIIEEAGGTFTDWQGTPTIRAGEAVATNGLVFEEVLSIARTAPPLPQG